MKKSKSAIRKWKTNFKVGDKIKVVGYRAAKYPPGMKDELGSEALFQSMVGQTYKIKGFDKYGHIELHPRRFEFVWIEPDLVELVKTVQIG